MSSSGGTGYRIWAVDNIVYGPVELPTLVGWIKDERVQEETWIFSESGDLWQKAGKIPELAQFYGAPRPAGSAQTDLPESTNSLAQAGIKPKALRRVRIFGGMSDEQLERFVEFMEVQKARQWSVIVKQGDPGDAMFLVLEGEVRVRLLVAERETILATLPVGEFFGDISLFDHGPRSADVVANQDSVLLKISAGAFQKLANEAPDLATPFLLAIGKTLTGRIRADNKRLRDALSFARVSGL